MITMKSTTTKPKKTAAVAAVSAGYFAAIFLAIDENQNTLPF